MIIVAVEEAAFLLAVLKSEKLVATRKGKQRRYEVLDPGDFLATARIAQITDDVATFTRDLPEGKGTLPMLVNDEELAEDVKAAVDTIRDVVDRINFYAPVVDDPETWGPVMEDLSRG